MKNNSVKQLASIFALLLLAVFSAVGFSACSETDDSVEEFPNWQSKNETYWNNLYTKAKGDTANSNGAWKIILNYSKQKQKSTSGVALTYAPEDYIIVHVEEAGTGTETPNYTDSVAVDYRGQLIPSTTYTSGLIFATNWNSTKYNASTTRPAHFAVFADDGVVVPGLKTAFQQMHKGDHWTVYIPYQLGFGTVSKGVVPAYSSLIYDIRLDDFAHPGTALRDK